jgi:1-acyl-sn-glycerol-3-phosphate acyltransferase
VLGLGFDGLVRTGLRGVWVRGQLPSVPAVWAANHHSWWDGFVAAAVLSHSHVPASMVVAGANLSSYGFLADAGVVAADRPRAALEALRTGRVLVVLPEGELRPPGPLGPLAPGAAWLARVAPAPLVPVAVRVAVRGHQHAEALVDLGAPVDPPDTDALAAAMTDGLARLDDVIATADPRTPPEGFRELVPGRRSWDERITRWSGRRPAGVRP